ncbi:sigma-70 family RNA polymerase sigma factor [Aeromicrobium sp. Leaf350]|uniref:sigma-70 family RNA polymerase sigma factor n=1 Tax=Aeromicrobium sp. Leaf350 TaxID=2876565 RepID=UPI001E3006A4|nr:sigma-70 family RNA polymerase sigma factor [Aeromicrobium sp. Leaf350]
MNDERTELALLDDATLLTRVREQRADADAAFETLYERHHGVATAMARRLGGTDMAPELVAEAFVRILSLLRRGAGPRTTFRAYMSATINSVWVDHLRANVRHVWVDDEERLEPLLSVDDGATARAEAGVIGAAFASLPRRWQSVLWLASVDEVSYDEIGRLFGLSPNGVAALVKRAREGLRQAYLTEHLGVRENPECLEIMPLLAAYVRGRASGRSVRRVESHLEGCAECREAVRELEGMSMRLGALLLPAIALAIVAGRERVGGLLVGDASVLETVAGLVPGAAGAAGAVGAGAAGVGAAVGAAGTASGGGLAVAVVAVAVLAVLGLASVVGERALDDRPVDVEIAGPPGEDVIAPAASPPPAAAPSVGPQTPAPPSGPGVVPMPTETLPPPAEGPVPSSPETPVDPVGPTAQDDAGIDTAGITVTPDPDPDLERWSLVSIPLRDVPEGSQVQLEGAGVDALLVYPTMQLVLMLGGDPSMLETTTDVLTFDVLHDPGATLTVTLVDAAGADRTNDSATIDLD